MSLTKKRLQYLTKIYDKQKESEMGMVEPKDIWSDMNENVLTVRVMMYRLRDAGLLDNPHRGLFKLSEEGLKALKKLGLG